MPRRVPPPVERRIKVPGAGAWRPVAALRDQPRVRRRDVAGLPVPAKAPVRGACARGPRRAVAGAAGVPSDRGGAPDERRSLRGLPEEPRGPLAASPPVSDPHAPLGLRAGDVNAASRPVPAPAGLRGPRAGSASRAPHAPLELRAPPVDASSRPPHAPLGLRAPPVDSASRGDHAPFGLRGAPVDPGRLLPRASRGGFELPPASSRDGGRSPRGAASPGVPATKRPAPRREKYGSVVLPALPPCALRRRLRSVAASRGADRGSDSVLLPARGDFAAARRASAALAAFALSGFARQTTRSLPKCCTGAQSRASHTVASIAWRSTRESLCTRILTSSCARSARSISCWTAGVSPCCPMKTTGSRWCALARISRRSVEVSADMRRSLPRARSCKVAQ